MEDKKRGLTEAEKRAKRKYHNNKRKKIACDVSIEFYTIVKNHATKKGFTSLNSYILHLINEDISK